MQDVYNYNTTGTTKLSYSLTQLHALNLQGHHQPSIRTC